ncbi:hypothetical protein EJ04DRAFT_599425 [Polyplosphaeria fusca]|uniref:Uncharacterized protein n=1 Tax=Polyplosphaeria fusca TaxID=682080 RepID=A0A9P4UVU0_9PLEO|nr:hypothetical protein EJ04DRAFT_599425 [Polyplosphaeria fusca]
MSDPPSPPSGSPRNYDDFSTYKMSSGALDTFNFDEFLSDPISDPYMFGPPSPSDPFNFVPPKENEESDNDLRTGLTSRPRVPLPLDDILESPYYLARSRRSRVSRTPQVSTPPSDTASGSRVASQLRQPERQFSEAPPSNPSSSSRDNVSDVDRRRIQRRGGLDNAFQDRQATTFHGPPRGSFGANHRLLTSVRGRGETPSRRRM